MHYRYVMTDGSIFKVHPHHIQMMTALVEDLLDPEVWGHSVPAEVRNEARRILGIKTREPV